MGESLSKTLRDGRYAVIRMLGEGAQGATFEAVDKRDGRLVAIKRFRVRGAKSWKEVELAEREARVLASISHPMLPRYIEHFEEGGELFLVTEKIEGESLLAIRKRGAVWSEEEVVRLLRDASFALDYLHGRAPPVIHRDIKPSNVLRRPDGSFALIDFGAVRDRMKPEGGSTVVGTFGYMAPEQFQGRAMAATDVYAVGATAISMLTGREPEDLPHRGLAIDVRSALSGNASPAMRDALASMLEPDPDKRASRIAPLLSKFGPSVKSGSPEAARAKAKSAEHAGRKPGRVEPPWTQSYPSGPPRVETPWGEPPWAEPPWNRKRDRKRDKREQKKARKERKEQEARGVHEAPSQSEEHAWRDWRDPHDIGRRMRLQWWQQRRPFVPGPVLFLMVLGMTIAQVAVSLALGVVVPVILVLLSLVFGRGMRAAAHGVRDAGKTAGRAIGYAKDVVSGRVGPDDAFAEPEAHRVRVDVPEEPRRVRVDDARGYGHRTSAYGEEEAAREEAAREEQAAREAEEERRARKRRR